MAGMLQILTYLLAFYLVIKGVEILQIALASNREKRAGIIALGVLTLAACFFAAAGFVTLQDRQVNSLGDSTQLELNTGAIRCQVCITFQGRQACRTASASTRELALRTATENACAVISSGVTDSGQCRNTPPDSVHWP